jgi:hypothetical protein
MSPRPYRRRIQIVSAQLAMLKRDFGDSFLLVPILVPSPFPVFSFFKVGVSICYHKMRAPTYALIQSQYNITTSWDPLAHDQTYCESVLVQLQTERVVSQFD